jgi:hypothetical protein
MTLYQDQMFSATELGLETLTPYIQVNISEKTDDNGETIPGVVTAVIDVREDLEFHRNLDREKGDPFNQMFAQDGEISPRVTEVLANIIRDRYNGDDFGIDGMTETSDDFFTFTIYLDVPAEIDAGRLGEMIWEDTELVKFSNEVDPGTFGSPYLFGSLIYDGLRGLDSE